MVEGFCQTDTPGQSFSAGPGDVLLMPAGMRHNQLDHGPVRSLYVGFDWPGRSVRKASTFHLPQMDFMVQSMDMLSRLHTRRLQASPAAANALLAGVLTEARGYMVPKRHHSTSDLRMADLLAWIPSHLHERLSVTELAQQAQVSDSRLFQLFAEVLNQSPMQYVQTQRMKRARQYLQDPYLAIKQVAHLCGYQDPNLFTRIFRQQHGLSPGRWRQQHCI